MSNVPNNLRYTKEHEWANLQEDMVTVGITDHAQSLLGDVVYLELPEVGDSVKIDQRFGVVESVKAVSDLFSPITGEVTAVNSNLVDAPEAVNTDPYGEAWMIKIKPAKAEELEGLMTADAYGQFVKDCH